MIHQYGPIQIRGSERIDFKRCQLKWYWHWKLGLLPRSKTFSALDLGTWVHAALATWYSAPNRIPRDLPIIMKAVIADAFSVAESTAPVEVLEGAEDLAALAMGMMQHYAAAYGRDKDLDVIATEVPLQFSFTVEPLVGQRIDVIHKLKPDAVVRYKRRDGVVLLETKTATTIRDAHIAIDDQARPYLAMAERALREAGVIGKRDVVTGILYNWLRKALPPDKPMNSEGLYLNKNGTVSARQPPPYFRRHMFPMSRRAKAFTLQRLHRECTKLAQQTHILRTMPKAWQLLDKTPHHSCPKFCDYFAMCALHDEGADISRMMKSMFTRQDPYQYEESTDEQHTFEMG